MRIDKEPKLDYDDVLIRPKRSEAPSRSTIIMEREYHFLASGATWTGIPLVAANMDTIGSFAMAKALGPQMLTCIHKYYEEADLINFFSNEDNQQIAFFTMGIKDDEIARLRNLADKTKFQYLMCRCRKWLYEIFR